jgi:phenylalanyl-tRNA synthetase beta chain
VLVSLSWLKKYVEIPVDSDALAENLTMTGLNVERRMGRGYSDANVVVGRVLEVRDHPNADKLTLCRVQVGPETTTEVVCGAPNVADGQLVLVAMPGAKLPDGTKIRSAKIRGERSDGMICSERELGLGDDASGIMVLDGDFALGAPITDVLGQPDEIFELEITPNRPDLLSHIGVAREISAIYQVPLKTPATGAGKEDGRADFDVEIVDSADCARYVGMRVSGIQVGPSPQWLSGALEAVGLHSVNNVVDVMNYVMMEMGQPLHAFDFKTLHGSEIIVRRAKSHEKLLALDGETYELDPDILVIADDREAVALAGVIGGEETAVHDDTVEILIESANFHATLVRSGHRSLGVPTDASYRFERGVDREQCRVAAERAAQLVCEVAGGKPGPVVDGYPGPWESKSLAVRCTAAQRLLGVSLNAEEIEALLARLGFEICGRTAQDVTVKVPSHRLDILEEADLVEEVGRLYGYNRIGKGWAYRCSTFATRDPFDVFLEDVATHMSSRGFGEVVGSSFTDGRELEDFAWPKEDPRSNPIAIRNPMNVNHRYLRTSLSPGMLDVARRNMDHDVKRLRMYQIGKVYWSVEGHSQLPEERRMLGLVLSQPQTSGFWNDTKQSLDLFDIKREIEILLQVFRIDLRPNIEYNFDESTGEFIYSFKDKTIIEGGIVSETVGLRYDFDQPVWFATIYIDELYRRVGERPKFKPLPEYPSSRRDLSLVAGPGIHFGEIEKSLVKLAGPLLESLKVFDVYAGESLGDDRTAYGVRLNFRSQERTLTDADVDKVIEKIVSNLKKQLGVELRT